MANAQPKTFPFSMDWMENFRYQETRYICDDFTGCGQDSFSQPPGQDPSMFAALTNIQPTVRRVIERRWGYELFSNPAFAVNNLAVYQNQTLGQKNIFYTGPTSVAYTDENGAGLATLFTPSSPTQKVRMVSSRDWAYFADGVPADLLKWNPGVSSTTSMWGLNIGQIATQVFGPNSPTVVTNTGWTNPNNVKALDGAVATITATAGAYPANKLIAKTYGFSIPAGEIVQGIQVDVYPTVFTTAGHSGHTNGVNGLTITLQKVAGTNYGNAEAIQSAYVPGEGANVIPVNQYNTVGGPNDLWGGTWSPADLNTSTFAVSMVAGTNLGTPTISIDHVRVTVYTNAPAVTVGAPGVGSIDLAVGRKYFYIFRNSQSGHSSDLSQASVSTGPLTSNDVPLSGIPGSTDPQVDTCTLLATADGGDETTLYWLTDLPNGTATYTDNTPEATLEASNVYQDTDSSGNFHGVADNSPPPNLLYPIEHLGRIYGVVGQGLYYSKNLDDCTTASGLITGKWEEAWPSFYVMDMSLGVEFARGLLSDGVYLYVGTERTIRKLSGDSPSNFGAAPEVLFSDVGILNQDVWVRTFREGTPAGVIWLTPDARVIHSDMNTYADIGTSIQDVLNSINLTVAQAISHAAFYSNAPYDIYVLAVPTGASTVCDTLLIYDLRYQRWYVWKPTDASTSLLANVTLGGVPQLIQAAPSAYAYQYLSGLTQDRVNNTPVGFTSTIQTSFLNLGDPTLRKVLNECEISTGDNSLTLSVDGANTNADFAAPYSVVSARPLVVGPLGDYKVYLAGAVTKHRYYRLTFVSPGTSSIILAGYNLDMVPLHRV